MKQQKFEIAETNILKDIKNQKIEKIYYTEPIYGRIKVTLNDYALLISNVMHEANLIGNDEDITYFTIDKVDKNYDFRYFGDDDSVKDIEVNEKVLSVSVVNDLIKYNNEYEISFDVAIIIKTDKHEYTISRDWFFMETMGIDIDKNIDDILDKERIIQHYRGEETTIPVTITRTKRKL